MIYKISEALREELRLVPELRHFAMAVAGNPCVDTIMTAIAAGYEYGRHVAAKEQ